MTETIQSLNNSLNLYKQNFDSISLKIRTGSYSSTDAGVTNYNIDNYFVNQQYNHFKITNIETSNVKSYKIEGWNKNTKSTVQLSTNTEYSISTINNLWVVVYSNTTGQLSYVIPTVNFYK